MEKTFRVQRALASAMLILFMMLPARADEGSAAFNANGSITCGDNSIVLGENGSLTINAGNAKISGRLAFFEINPETKKQKWFTTDSLENKSLKINAENRQIIFKGTYNHKATGKSMETCISVRLNADGLVNVRYGYNTSELFNEKILARGWLYFESSYHNFINETIKVGDRVFAFELGKELKTSDLRSSDKVVYFADNSSKRIAFSPLEGGVHLTFPQSGGSERYVYLSIGENFDVDLGVKNQSEKLNTSPKKSDISANYYPLDDLYGPRYDLCRNLVQNPSFEAGYRYWRNWCQNYRNPDNFYIDSSVFYKGRRSLRLYGKKGCRLDVGFPSTFAIPVERGQEYTLSFYARGDSNYNEKVFHVYAQYGTGCKGEALEPLDLWLKLTSDWKRYSAAFKASDNILSITFHIQLPANDCIAWIDCVQLEKGNLTEYTEKPVCAELAANSSDNLFQPEEKMNAHLEINTTAGTKGWVELSLKDFFGKEVYKDKIKFSANKDGFALCAVPLDNKRLPTGIYVLKADFTLDSGYNDQDYFRLGIMNYLDNRFKHKNMFAIMSVTTESGVQAERMRRMGVGACMSSGFDPPPAAYTREMQRNNILAVCSIFRMGEYVGESPTGHWALSGKRGDKEWSVKDVNPDLINLEMVKEASHKKVVQHPEITCWKLCNEPAVDLKNRPGDMKRYVLIMKAACDGIKLGNPDAVVLSPDPANLDPGGGIHWLDTYLQAGGLKTFDVIAVHPYRKRPEEPDLDTDIATFITMLKKHGYTGDIWFTEGMAWIKYIIPAYGLDTADWNSAMSDRYKAGTISYDLGYGEKLAAAYCARSWLASLKNSSRVKMSLAWSPSLDDLDLNGTPDVAKWIPNILGHILGNADYYQDIEVKSDIRCYVFQNENNQPIAVFWNTDSMIELKIKQEGPVLTLPFNQNEVEIIDIMGKTYPGNNMQLAITPFPVFIRGKSGTTDSFCKRLLENLSGPDFIHSIRSSVKVRGAGKAEVSLRNMLSSKNKAKVSIQCQGKTIIDEKISINGKGERTFSIPFSRPSNIFDKISLKVSFLREGQSQPQEEDLSFVLLTSKKRKNAIIIDGNLSDWGKDFEISLPDIFKEFPVPLNLVPKFGNPIPWKGEDDLSAVLYSCWDEDNFYLAVKIKDDVFAPPPDLEGSYLYDTLQVYFDALCDARSKRTIKKFDENDYNYNFNPLKEGLKVMRDWAPDKQVAFLDKGPAPEVKCVFRRLKDGMIYEIAFPARQVFPVSLKKGSSFGFALLINDNDNDYRKRGLTLTPQGTEPYMRPDLYPVMCLVE